MPRFSRAEAALLLIPILIIPAVIMAQKWNAANRPRSVPVAVVPKPRPLPFPNLYADAVANTQFISPSPDGKTIYTGDIGGRIKYSVWDARTGGLIRSHIIPGSHYAGAVFSPSGKLMAFRFDSPSHGDSVLLFDRARGLHKLRIWKREATGHGFDLNDDVVAMPTDDTMRLFSTRNGKRVGELSHRADDFYPTKPRFSPDGKQLLWIGFTLHKPESYANGNANDEIVWFDVKSRKLINAVDLPQMEIANACFSGDGNVILAIAFRHYWVRSRQVQSRQAQNRATKSAIVNKGAIATKVSIATEPRFFAIDARTGKQLYTWAASHWPAATRKQLHNYFISQWPYEMAVSPDGKWFTFPRSQGTEARLRNYTAVHEVRTGREVHAVETAFPNAGAWSPDSKTLYLQDEVIWRLQLQNGGNWQLNKGNLR
jgi:WD40 repeat protein